MPDRLDPGVDDWTPLAILVRSENDAILLRRKNKKNIAKYVGQTANGLPAIYFISHIRKNFQNAGLHRVHPIGAAAFKRNFPRRIKFPLLHFEVDKEDGHREYDRTGFMVGERTRQGKGKVL